MGSSGRAGSGSKEVPLAGGALWAGRPTGGEVMGGEGAVAPQSKHGGRMLRPPGIWPSLCGLPSLGMRFIRGLASLLPCDLAMSVGRRAARRRERRSRAARGRTARGREARGGEARGWAGSGRRVGGGAQARGRQAAGGRRWAGGHRAGGRAAGGRAACGRSSGARAGCGSIPPSPTASLGSSTSRTPTQGYKRFRSRGCPSRAFGREREG